MPRLASLAVLSMGQKMLNVKFVSWEEDGAWLGYLEDYPEFWTQGETLDDLIEHLEDLCRDAVFFCTP
jgi:hypothetical protein